jgi:hypothetical protein
MLGVPEIMAGVKKTAIRPHFAGSVSALAAALRRSDHQLSWISAVASALPSFTAARSAA